MSNNIREYFSATFCGNNCGHSHRTFTAAENCAKDTIRAAVRATQGKREKFYNSDLIAGWADNDSAIFVTSRLIAL